MTLREKIFPFFFKKKEVVHNNYTDNVWNLLLEYAKSCNSQYTNEIDRDIVFLCINKKAKIELSGSELAIFKEKANEMHKVDDSFIRKMQDADQIKRFWDENPGLEKSNFLELVSHYFNEDTILYVELHINEGIKMARKKRSKGKFRILNAEEIQEMNKLLKQIKPKTKA